MISVFIVDQQPLFRQGIRASLSHISDIEIVGESGAGDDVLATIETLLPDVVLVGVNAGLEDVEEPCRAIKQRLPSVAAIILTSQPQDEQLFGAIKAQASAYLGKDVDARELVQAITRCARGEHPINENLAARPKVAERILKQFHELSAEKEAATFISPLTRREAEILDYMAQGYLNKQIAVELSISEQTVKNHITSILRKLNANARTHAVVIAIRKGLISIARE